MNELELFIALRWALYGIDPEESLIHNWIAQIEDMEPVEIPKSIADPQELFKRIVTAPDV